MKKTLIFILVLSAGFGIFEFRNRISHQEYQTEGIELIQEYKPEITKKIETVQDDDTFTAILERLDITYSEALAIVAAAEGIFDFTSIRLGKQFSTVYEDGERIRLEYEPNSEDRVIVDLTNDSYETFIIPIPYDIEIDQAAVTIDESMFVSGLNAGLDEVLILKIAEVFAWEIDFATQTQNGDSFKVLYEKRYKDGEYAGIGDVLATSFTNVGDSFYGYRYYNENGQLTYYDQDGNSMVKAFLKAPLSFSRITSGYTNARFHPVLGTTMPHRAIDYGAPTGTPIMAVADGKITLASWNGGYGNMVKISHNDIYDTHYAHLSAYADGIVPGARVSQGDIIGYVGSTGYSTGPHLHYEVAVYGELVNPLDVEFPEGDPISEEQKPYFFEQKAEYDAMIDL